MKTSGALVLTCSIGAVPGGKAFAQATGAGPYPDPDHLALDIAHVRGNSGVGPFLFLSVGGGTRLGGVNSEQQAIRMAQALREAGVRAETVSLWNEEHYSANEAIGEPGTAATIAVTRFLTSLLDSRQAQGD